jgi:choloylglycine hydrolase
MFAVSNVSRRVFSVLVFLALVGGPPTKIWACTGVTLRADDGTVVYGRTVEWGAFDLKSRVMVVPRGTRFNSELGQFGAGMTWAAKYGVVGIDALEKPGIVDGINEKGLAVGAFYLPGFTEYQAFDAAHADDSLGPLDLANYILTSFATIDEVRAGLEGIRVVPVVEAALGFPPPLHFIVTDPGSEAIVVEYVDGELVVFDNPLGVITNAPTFDWHLTNHRKFINLSQTSLPTVTIDKLDFTALGAGSGMIGLPGDFTPPSRFVRAVAFSKTARPTANGGETIYELFRILDNFNVPLGAAEGSTLGGESSNMRSSTLWTSAADTRNLVYYYHTQHNRRVRAVELGEIDFESLPPGARFFPLDKKRQQDIEVLKVLD